ncbi:microcin C transport system substrate-binding protein [Loktanella ponticola]|uniref:Microcin C transport system substrate-binding protein n=1 Tax=Yoonia ponticola TaxID=1524255 RepID=A0A7W9BI60_9RHOB|nr:extracellular solute-binding protein [Yoonia ponticola]MBB5721008.1 microcin C transport system substrate-binding protein [Yoonia ponticola]
MQNRHQNHAIARTHDVTASRKAVWMSGTAILVGMMLLAGKAFAQDNVTVSHAYNEYGDIKYPADFAHLDYVNPDAPLGGEISISASGTFDSMNPFATLEGTPGALSSIVWERLMTATSDEVGTMYCLVCETLEYPDDQSWVIFNLRKDVAFSDGRPMTAEDVIFTHELMREQSTPSFRQGIVALVDTYEALDDYTVKFTFNPDAPTRGRIIQMANALVMQKAWFEETGARMDQSGLEASPGTAEYVTASVDPGRQIIYERNADYWGKDLPINVGRGNFDSIRIEYFADTSAAFEAFKAGEFTFRTETSSINWATSYDFPAIENEWVVRQEFEDGTLPAATGFVFNLRDPKFADRRVRQAIGLVYNFTWTNDNLQYGLFQQRESFWENDRLKAAGLPTGRELEILEALGDKIDPEILTTEAVMPHRSGDRPLDRGNLRAALALMEEAGWVTGDDGLLRNADGKTLDVEFLETRQSFDRIINPYIENLKRLGVNITYNRVDPAQYQARTQDNDFEMLFGYWVNGLQEGTGFSQKFGCEDKDDVFNPAGYCSEAIDAIGDQIAAADDYDEMAALVRAADRIMRHEYFIVPIWYLGKNWAAYFDMYEHPENLPEFGLGHLDYWWFNDEKFEALKSAGALR